MKTQLVRLLTAPPRRKQDKRGKRLKEQERGSKWEEPRLRKRQLCQASKAAVGGAGKPPRASHPAGHSPVLCQGQLRNSPGFLGLCPTSSLLPWVIVEDTEAHGK